MREHFTYMSTTAGWLVRERESHVAWLGNRLNGLHQLSELTRQLLCFAQPAPIRTLPSSLTMSSLRAARSVLRVKPTVFRAPLQRRGYADVASDKIKLSLVLPHQVCAISYPN